MKVLPTRVNLAHYFYFPKDDLESVQFLWNDIVNAYSLKETTLDALWSKREPALSSAPYLVTDERVAAGILFQENLIIVEILLLTAQKMNSSRFWQTNFPALEELRGKIDKVLGKALGETTIFVGEPAEKELVFREIEHLLGQTKSLEEKLAQGVLFLISPDEEKNRLFFVYQSSEENYSFPLLTTTLPSITALILKIKRQLGYFNKQRRSILKEMSETDQTLSKILYQRGIALPSGKERIDVLEDEIGKLSKMYGYLAGDLTILKNTHDALTKDLAILHSHLGEILDKEGNTSAFDTQYLNRFREHLNQTAIDREAVRDSLENVKAGMDVVRTRVELERSSESLALQEEGFALQIAAIFIEFVLVFYYSLSTWKILATPLRFEQIPTVIRGISVLTLSLSIVFFTHFIAKSLIKRRIHKNLIFSFLIILITLGAMITLTLYYSQVYA